MSVFGDDYVTPDGTCIRDYIHVTDLATGHLAALDYIVSEKRSLVVNLGSEVGLSVTEMVEAARRLTGVPIPSVVTGRRPGDPAKLVSSAGLAHELLGWKAVHSDVDSLVSTTWEAYQREQ